MKDILYIHLEREGTVSIHLSLSINRQIVAFKKTTLTVLKPFNVNTSVRKKITLISIAVMN